MYIYNKYYMNGKNSFKKEICTSSLIRLPFLKCLCVSISVGKPSIYFLLNVGYPLRPSRRVPSSSSSSVRPSRRPSRRRRPFSVRPSTSVVVVRPLSVRPSRRPSRRCRPSSVRPSTSVRRLSVRPVVRLNITCKTSRSIRRI